MLTKMDETDDFQCMRSERYRLNRSFVGLYISHFGASKPEADFDDRNALYSLLVDSPLS
jgi:hypothetical protein